MNLSQRFDLAALSKGNTRRKQVVFRPIRVRMSFEAALYRIVAELATVLQAQRADILQAAARLRSDLVLDNALDSVMAELERGFARVIALSRRKVDSLFHGEARRHDESWLQQVNRVVGVDLKAVVRSEQIQPAIDLAVQKNVALIKGLSEDVRKRIETQVIDLVSRGASNKEIAKTLGEIGNFTKNRAKLIAVDQASSFNANLNEIRQTQAGISKYVWSTSHDNRVRPLHRQRDGQTYRWDSPPSDGHPGQPVRCRCTAIAVLDYEDAPKPRSGRQRAGEAGLEAVRAALRALTQGQPMMFATDTVALGDVRVNDAGYLEAFARTARTGTQQYTGSEMGRPDLPIVTVYRDADEVFSKASLQSFAQIPVTVDHPPEGVTAANWRQYARGTTGNDVLRDGEFLKIGLKIKDAAAIAEVRAGKSQLSVGYRTEIVWGDGVAPDGTRYQAKQTGIVADHIAIVSAGRAGAQCRIGDSWADFNTGSSREPGSHEQRNNDGNPPAMKTLTIDGHSVELSDAAVIAVANLQKQLGDALANTLAKDAALTTATADHKKALEAKDGEVLKLQAEHAVAITAKDKEIADLKALTVTADKLDAAVAERTAVVDAAKPYLGATFDAKGKTVADIRRAVVAKRLGDKAVEGKTDEHVSIAFDTLTAVAPVADALGNAIQHAVGDAAGDPRAAAYKAMLDHQNGAWQHKAA